MLRKISIYCFFLGVLIVGLLFSHHIKHQDSAQISPSPAPSPPISAPILSEGSSSSAPSSDPFKLSVPVTLQEISLLTDSAEFNELYQRLTSELIHELIQLKSIHDRDRIISRITPMAQKFYYLKKEHQSREDTPSFQLPLSFRSDIQNLEKLWESNNTLAQAADSVFSRMELLDNEHVPYQLREQILAQHTDQ